MVKIGEKYHRLTALQAMDLRKGGHKIYEFVCDCGTIKHLKGTHVYNGVIKSCGCLRGNTYIKPVRGTPTYRAWQDMKTRCYNTNSKAYRYYGERGIGVCDRWKNSYPNFLSDMGERPPGLSLDRIDNDKGYSPDNCRWADWKTQMNNRRDYGRC